MLGPLLAVEVAIAPPAARWEVRGKPGASTLLVGHVKTGGRIVADGFVSQSDLVDDERGQLRNPMAKPGQCSWAKGVRPFTRLRRFSADGRLLWEWHVDRIEQALRLAASWDADCLSPDGSRLTVEIYHHGSDDPAFPMGRSVVAVDHRPRFIEERDLRTHEDIGDRDVDFIGWKRGSPATLLFDVARDEGKTVIHDEAVLGSPRRR